MSNPLSAVNSDALQMSGDLGASSCASQRGLDSRWEDLADFAFQPQREPWLTVMLGRPAINNDVGETAFCCHERKPSGWINGQGRAKRDYEIGLARRLSRALQLSRIKVLTEANRRRFQESPALTKRRPAAFSKRFEMRLRIIAPVATLTLDQRISAVKLDQALRARPATFPASSNRTMA